MQKILSLPLLALAMLFPSFSQAATINLDWGVSINSVYDPLTINAGDTVTWTWVDPFAISHNVVIQDATNTVIFETPLTSGAGTMVSYTFMDEGEFSFYCAPHQGSMNGSLSVSAVPVPAAAWLFVSGLIGIVGISRRKKALN